jgi:hypothetical protein
VLRFYPDQRPISGVAGLGSPGRHAGPPGGVSRRTVGRRPAVSWVRRCLGRGPGRRRAPACPCGRPPLAPFEGADRPDAQAGALGQRLLRQLGATAVPAELLCQTGALDLDRGSASAPRLVSARRNLPAQLAPGSGARGLRLTPSQRLSTWSAGPSYLSRSSPSPRGSLPDAGWAAAARTARTSRAVCAIATFPPRLRARAVTASPARRPATTSTGSGVLDGGGCGRPSSGRPPSGGVGLRPAHALAPATTSRPRASGAARMDDSWSAAHSQAPPRTNPSATPAHSSPRTARIANQSHRTGRGSRRRNPRFTAPEHSVSQHAGREQRSSHATYSPPLDTLSSCTAGPPPPAAAAAARPAGPPPRSRCRCRRPHPSLELRSGRGACQPAEDVPSREAGGRLRSEDGWSGAPAYFERHRSERLPFAIRSGHGLPRPGSDRGSDRRPDQSRHPRRAHRRPCAYGRRPRRAHWA